MRLEGSTFNASGYLLDFFAVTARFLTRFAAGAAPRDAPAADRGDDVRAAPRVAGGRSAYSYASRSQSVIGAST